MHTSRRRLLRAVGTAGLFGAAGCVGSFGGGRGGGTGAGGAGAGDGSSAGDGGPTDGTTADGATETAAPGGVGTEVIAEGFTSPVAFEAAPGTDRRFVVDQPGVIYELTDGGSEPYFDLRDRIVDVSGRSEQGLLGLAFHPNFAENGRLFVRYSAPNRPGTPDGYSHTFVLAEYRVDPGADRVSPGRDAEIAHLEIPEPQSNHNAGAVVFGPDGLLYVPTGDGGNANDVGAGHVDDWYDAVDGGNGQDVTENLLGSVLRIDVDGEGGDRPYAIPDDNPLVGREGLGEHFAWGFRNPWRLSFEPLSDGPALIAGDVGQGAREELDVVRRGGNYGWNVREGAPCFRADDCPSETPDGDPLIDPVYDYPHSADSGPAGIAIIAGHVVPEGGVPALAGRYVFADWRAGGRLFVADPTGDDWAAEVVQVAGGADRLPMINAFGRHGSDVYVCVTGSGSTGTVQRLVAAE